MLGCCLPGVNGKFTLRIDPDAKPYFVPVKHGLPWTIRGTKPSETPIEPSVHEPLYSSPDALSPKRLEIRKRPMSATYHNFKKPRKET